MEGIRRVLAEREALAVIINIARGWQCARLACGGEPEGAVRVQHDQFDGTIASYWSPLAGHWLGSVYIGGELAYVLPSPAPEASALSVAATEIIEAVESAAWQESWGREMRVLITLSQGAVVSVEGLPYGAKYELVDRERDVLDADILNDAAPGEMIDDDAHPAGDRVGASLMPPSLRRTLALKTGG